MKAKLALGDRRAVSPRVSALGHGFTLVELLVAISFVGLLMAILLPAVQQARERARNVQCQNNLRQIALGAQLHIDTFGKLPPGRTSWEPPAHRGWQVALLPFIEQEPIFRDTEQAYAQSPFPYENPPHSAFAIAIPTYACPSDSRVASPQPAQTLGGKLVGLTSYLGVSGLAYDDNLGVLFESSSVRPADVLDGLSNTLLCGERPPSYNHNLGWWYTGVGQDGAGNADMFMGVHERESGGSAETLFCGGPHRFSKGSLAHRCDTLKYWSYHPSGANFAYLDGRVQWQDYQGAEVLWSLATRAGGD